MKDFLKNKLVTGLIIAGTVILAGVAIFTAIRLYQLRTRPVAPTAPESAPQASGVEPTPTPEACRDLAFTLTIPSPTPTGVTPTPTGVTPTPTTKVTTTPQPTPTVTNTPTATVTPPIGGQPSPTPTPTSTPTSTPKATVTPTQVITATPTPPTLPQAGVAFPTLILISFSLLLIIASLVIAL